MSMERMEAWQPAESALPRKKAALLFICQFLERMQFFERKKFPSVNKATCDSVHNDGKKKLFQCFRDFCRSYIPPKAFTVKRTCSE